MRMRICDVIEKIKDIDMAIELTDHEQGVVDLLNEYKDKILMTTVDI